MLGCIAGDIIGSRFEFQPIKHRQFELFAPDSRFTDDTVLSLAVAESLMTGMGFAESFRLFGRRYPDAGYGGFFARWVTAENEGPYYSLGNGSAMRVSPVAWFYDDLDSVSAAAVASASVTHNHPEGIKGAQAVAAAVLLCRQGRNKSDIKRYLEREFRYDLSRTLEEIRPGYGFDVTCEGAVPEALICFLEAESFEDAVRNAVSLGGDADTQACIAGAVSEAYFGEVPEPIRIQTLAKLGAC